MHGPSSSPSTPASFRLADGLGYALQQSHRSVIRLNLQHFLWREVFGFHMHPSVQFPSSDSSTDSSSRPAIADIATGTALWLIDVSRDFPKSRLDGLDIDLTQAPHPGWLPSNITLRHWDVFADIPASLQSQYDLVHVRLLVLVLSGVDPMPVIRRLFQLVKPGGYIQWDELDCVNMRIKKVSPSVQAPALEEIRVASYANGRHDWVLDLPRLLNEAGFEDAKLDYYDEGPELVRAFNDQHLLTMEEFGSKLMGNGQAEAAASFLKLIQAGYQECVDGAALSIPRVVVVAKRPGSA
ncbi:UMTA methyltransferase family protein [Aspergillus nomiae NRRL 13137]|uniref:UMTA methyltransferase family protein n=1 Tax=Aspergillus nomiae NRRL (strain ATCC 15546 / NRRL 13137 / CBS 260.88 / M93) TaxID=1509407 RepID=A0A0L1JJW0_ASPN3|nr:UMTA methyltransferase family protein [Aspergillus nomiae NRRL 13137]KNG91708.1 UMTA methyltransferase family protein [Aspergillus nomiae NRRL 13137]